MINSLKKRLDLTSLKESQKKGYEEFLLPKKILSARLNSLIAIFLYFFIMVLDSYLLPSNISAVLISNTFVVITLALTFLSTFHSIFIKNYQVIIPLAFIVPSFSIEYLISLSTPSDIAYFLLIVPLVITIMTLFSWAHLSAKVLATTTFVIIAGLIAALYSRIGHGTYDVTLILVSNLFFIFCALSIGVVSKLMRDNYLIKNYQLNLSLKTLLEEKTEEVEKFEFYSNHDQLTGLSNRRFAEKNFEKKLEEIDKSEDKSLVLMFLDLNRFKEINDNYGHDAGDKVLRVTAERLRDCTPCEDNLVRLGGDEFLLCLTVNKNDDSALIQMEKTIEASISKPIDYHGHRLTIGTSIGCARYPEEGEDLKSLIKHADEKMYKDKLSKKIMIPRKRDLQQRSA